MSGFRNLALTFLVCTLLLNSSCAPTEDEVITADNVQREGSPGIFLDSAVGGVDYTTTSGLGGVTDSSGRFYYNPGDQVSFTIGGISLGSVTGAAKLTPVEVMGASGTADQKVINLSRLLQTLDADGDPSNGISINDSTKTTLAAKSVNFDVSVEAFDNATKSVTAAVGKTMVTATRAIKHLHSTLNDQGLSSKVASDADLQSVSSELDNFTTVAANFTVSENATALTEASGSSHTDTFTVVLASEPVGNVVFSVVPSDASEVSSSPSSLTFSPDNWSTAQTVTLTGTDDEISDGTISSAVTVGINESQTKDSEYDKLKSHSISATTSDDEGIPSVTLTAAIVSLVEDEETLTLTVNMSLASGVDTTVDFTTSGTAERDADYSITPDPLIIPSGSKQGTVTVKSINDEIDDDAETIIIGVGAGSISNSVGATNNIQDVTLTISDDDTAGFQLSKTTAAVTESGTKDTFTVVLDSKPTHDVIVTLTSDDTGEATVSPDNLTFTSEDWNTAQTVTITGVADDQVDKNATSTITVSVNSSDTNYISSKLSDKEVKVTTSDGDTAGFKLSETTVNATEGGDNATFTVELTSKPTSAVTIGIAGSTEASVSPTSLSFDASDWKTPKTVTVTAVNDSVDDDQQTSTITISVSSSSDSKYGSGISNQSVTATTKDDDTAGFTLSKNTATVTEGGDSDNFTVVLNSEPTRDVVLTLTANDLTEVSISSSSTLTFTSANWNTAQTVIIAAADENLDDDNITSTVTVAVSSTNDEKYDNLTSQVVTVTTVDNDGTPQVTLTVDNSSMSETGGVVTLTVNMSTAATSDTTVALYASGTATLNTDYELSSTTLTVYADNTTATAALTGISDQFVEGSESIVVDISGVSGGNGASESGTQQQVITITDDDNATVTIADVIELESAGTATVTLSLNNAVAGGFSVGVATTDGTATAGSDYTALSSTVTFAGSAGETQQVSITLGSDSTVEDNETITISMSNASNSGVIVTDTATLTITNDDTATVTIDNVSVSESAGTATLTLSLNKALPSAFTVSLSSADGTATQVGTGSGDYESLSTTVTIPAGTTSVEQSLTINSDIVVEDDETLTVSLGTPSDSRVSSGSAATVTITNDDTAGFSLSGTTASVSENGTSSSISVVLTSEPTSTVTLTLSDNDTSEVIYPTSVMFDSGNWSTSQTITLTGKDDNVSDGSQTTLLTLTPSGGGYSGLSSQTLTVTTADNDTVGFILSGTTASVSENGTSSNISVVLTSEPTSTVTLTLLDNGTSEVIYPTSVMFDSGNWSTSQTITLTGKDDNVSDGSQTTLLTLTPSGGGYSGLSSQTLTVTTADNDTAGFSLSGTTASVSENGTSSGISVVLTSEPTSTVTLTLSDNDTSEVIYPTSVVFDSGNWSTSQTITLTGKDDEIVDDSQTTLLTLKPSGGDYSGLSSQTLTVTTTDNDTATVTIADVSSVNEGDNATITLSVDLEVVGGFTVNVSTADGTATAGSDYTAVSSQQVTFVGTAEETQTLDVVTASNDENNEPDETFTISMSNSSKSSVVVTDNATVTIVNVNGGGSGGQGGNPNNP